MWQIDSTMLDFNNFVSYERNEICKKRESRQQQLVDQNTNILAYLEIMDDTLRNYFSRTFLFFGGGSLVRSRCPVHSESTWPWRLISQMWQNRKCHWEAFPGSLGKTIDPAMQGRALCQSYRTLNTGEIAEKITFL